MTPSPAPPAATAAPTAPTTVSERLRRRLEARLGRLWFAQAPTTGDRLLGAALAPLSWLAGRIALRRRARRLARGERPPVPLVIVGNLLVGGTGKTPITVAIARALSARGRRVGLVAGGYRARLPGPHLVTAASDPHDVGDEPVLLAQASGLPVAAGRARRDALDRLLAAHPDLDCVVADDGLQHEALPRTVELAVFDARGLGNGRLLPAGPLREPSAVASGLDALLLNGTDRSPVDHPHVWPVPIAPVGARRLADGVREPVEAFRARCAGRRVVAVAGIAQPARFFMSLAALGIAAETLPLPDHARLSPGWTDAITADVIVMTDKDAVKSGLVADPRCWSLVIEARPPAAFIDWLLERLHGHPTA